MAIRAPDGANKEKMKMIVNKTECKIQPTFQSKNSELQSGSRVEKGATHAILSISMPFNWIMGIGFFSQ